jgi:tellurite resistance protein
MFAKLKERMTGGVSKMSGKLDLLEGIAAMSALVSCADGDIEDSEVEAVINSLAAHDTLSQAFTSSQMEAAVNKQFQRAKGGMAGKLGLKKEIDEAKSKNTSEEMEMALMIAIDVAMSDGEMEAPEKKVLDDLAKRLGFNLSAYI